MPDAPGDSAAELRPANASLRELLAERDTEIADLRALVAELQAQVADLTARVRQNSENSSRPTSSDGLAKPAPKSLRARSGQKPGRPKGQPGVTMRLSDYPDRVVRHEPSCCAGCERGLAGAPEAGMIRRQVTEIPPVRAEVTEHQMIGRRCGCGTVSWGTAPDGVTVPVQYGPRAAALGAYLWHGQFLSRDRACAAMADMFGCAPSAGTLAAMTRKIAALTPRRLMPSSRRCWPLRSRTSTRQGSGSRGSWLAVSTSSGSGPHNVNVTADPGRSARDCGHLPPIFRR